MTEHSPNNFEFKGPGFKVSASGRFAVGVAAVISLAAFFGVLSGRAFGWW